MNHKKELLKSLWVIPKLAVDETRQSPLKKPPEGDVEGSGVGV